MLIYHKHNHTMTILGDLPKELFLIIVSFLDVSSKFALSRTSKFYVRIMKVHLTRNIFNVMNRYLIIQSRHTNLQPRIVINMTSIHLNAICNGYENLTKWLITDPDKSRLSDTLMFTYCKQAARGGFIEIVKYLFKHVSANDIPERDIALGVDRKHLIMNAAVKGGCLDTVKWLRENGCSLNEQFCADAFQRGHIDILKWLHEEECPCKIIDCIYCIKNEWLLHKENELESVL